MNTVCKENLCDGCMACVDVCNQKAITVKDDIQYFNAVIDEDKCVKCGKCYRVCQRNNSVGFSTPRKWMQGWAKDANSRKKSASGGFAFEIAKKFISEGGLVYACSFKGGKFKYHFYDDIDSLVEIRGSNYVKSNPEGGYAKACELLKAGRKVLVIGLPCHIAAFRNSIPIDIQENLYLVDLICHGTPSSKLLECFLKQYGISLDRIGKIKFRNKERFALGEIGVVQEGVIDRYTMAYLNSILHTENCYNCKYATINRCSDLTIGDSWGSKLEQSEIACGISLAMAINEKGLSLMDSADLILKDVDSDIATAANRQLNGTSIKPPEYSVFYKYFNKGKSFNYSVYKCFPKLAIKQDIKSILIRLKLYKGGVIPYRISVVISDDNLEE